MKLLIQRVSSASVSVDNQKIASMRKGLLVLVGFCQTDTIHTVDQLTNKLLHLRIFSDKEDKMNLSILDIKGELLIVSQFTLYADTRKGNRPSFTNTASPEMAQALYNYFVKKCKTSGLKVATGEFATYMQVELINDGPVTILL